MLTQKLLAQEPSPSETASITEAGTPDHRSTDHRIAPPDSKTNSLCHRHSLKRQDLHHNTDDTPPELRISPATWVRVLLAWMLSVTCGGLLPGQALFTQKFAEAGVYADLCDGGTPSGAGPAAQAQGTNSQSQSQSLCQAQYVALASMFNALQMMAIVALLPAGLCFDAIGGRATAVIGAALLLAGLLLLHIVLENVVVIDAGIDIDGHPVDQQKSSNKALLENLLFPVGLLLTDCGSWINSMGLFGFLFHVPGHNGLLLSLSNSCYYIAAFLPVVLQTLLMDRGYSFPDALLLYCVPVSVAMVGGYFVIPAQNEYYKQATEVLTMPIPRPRPSSNWKAWGKKMRHTIASAFAVLNRREHRAKHVKLLSAVLIAACSIFVYISLPDPYVVALFHGNTAIGSEIAAYVVTSLAWMGLVVSPVVGVLIDYRTLVYGDGDGNGSNSETRQREKHNHLGFKLVILLCCASLLVVGCFCLVPNLEAQKVVVTAVNLVQVSTNTIMMRYILLFTPANRVGTVSGAFLASLGFFAVFGILGMSVAVNDVMPLLLRKFEHGVAKEDGVYTRLKADVVAWQNSGSKSNVLPPSVASYVESTTAEDEDHHQVMTAKGSLVERESFLVDLVMRRLDSAKAVIHDEECTLTALKYAVPTIFTVLLAICAFGVFLADMNSRGDYLPSEPPLLPEDELEVCRRFGVASVEDAAFVLGVDRGEVLRLCASGNVLDMRRLVQLMAKSGPRLVELAKKKTLTINRNDDFGYSELPGGAGSCDGIEDVDAELVAPLPSRRLSVSVRPPVDVGSGSSTGTSATSCSRSPSATSFNLSDRKAAPEEVVKLIVDSFWPAEEAGYKGSPLLDWLSFSGRRGASLRRSSLVSRGDVVVEEDEQVDRLHKLLAYQNAITYHIAARYGHVLELSTTTGVGEDDENPPDTVENNDKDNTKIITSKDKEDKVKANCGENKNKLCCGLLCLPPGRFPTVGSSEYYYGLAKAGVPFPGYPSAEMMERDMALSAVLEGGGSPEHDRRALPPHYYVASLATCGDARGRGLAKILLDVVKKRGQRCTRW
eukprot:CAMPEP_0179004476 /NCGR_PEP_ID=MMETSP0795-20121207/13327_1 /TAXON_ID=88552 /ORGANISM="Amoebophrya sp., Strain Ameob2" /LENGTH=1056 /DNA_ID=CAMNT_0020698745 /DNA_START=718 /DNA_END=3888 /DNA_ORIENTATION=+